MKCNEFPMNYSELCIKQFEQKLKFSGFIEQKFKIMKFGSEEVSGMVFDRIYRQ